MFKKGGATSPVGMPGRQTSLVKPSCRIPGFKEVEEIGQGGFGIVFKARHEIDGEVYALKRVRIRASDKMNRLVGEVKMLTKLDHRNVVRYYNSWIEENCDYVSDTESEAETETETEEEEEEVVNELPVSKPPEKHHEISIANPRVLFIQMEYCGTSTLRSYVDEGFCQKKSCRMKIINSTLDGLDYLHSQAIIHRDLKPENIFIHNDKIGAKIGDFGLATKVRWKVHKRKRPRRRPSYIMGKENLTTNIGSRMYVCPEILCDEPKSKYGQEVDIYSLGIIFFEVSYRPLSTGMERSKILGLVRSERIIFPDDFETEVKVLEDMLDHDPQKRPTAKSIKKSLQSSSNPKTPGLSKKDYLYALINNILTKRDQGSELMPLTDLEAEIVSSFRGLCPTNSVTRFDDVCDTRLLSLLQKKASLYSLTKSNRGNMYVRLKETADVVVAETQASSHVPRLDLLLL